MGPATDDDEVLKDLMRSGMDIARLNFSHGDHEEQLGRINFQKFCFLTCRFDSFDNRLCHCLCITGSTPIYN